MVLGRDWLASIQLDWNELFYADHSSTRLQEVINKYSEVFRDELRTLNGRKAKIYVKENSKPQFYRHRAVPYALRAGVEKELDRLEKEGIIEPGSILRMGSTHRTSKKERWVGAYLWRLQAHSQQGCRA